MVTWRSLNPSLLSINSSGLASALAVGVTEVEVAYQGLSLRAPITIQQLPPPPPPPVTLLSITILPGGTITLDIGQTRPFVATGRYSDSSYQDVTNLVAWNSSNPSVASINSAGIVTALAGGSTQIRASLAGIASSPTTVNVNSPPTGPILTTGGAFPVVPSSLRIGDPLPASWKCFNGGDQNGQALLRVINNSVDPFSYYDSPLGLIFPSSWTDLFLDRVVTLNPGANLMTISVVEVTGQIVNSFNWSLNATSPPVIARFNIGQFVVTSPAATFGGEILDRRQHSSGAYYEYLIDRCNGGLWAGDSQNLFALFRPPLFVPGESVIVVQFTGPQVPGVIQCREVRSDEAFGPTWVYNIVRSDGLGTITQWPEEMILVNE